MSAAFYQEMVSVGQELIEFFGRDVVLVRPARVVDPEKPWLDDPVAGANDEEQRITTKAVILDNKKRPLDLRVAQQHGASALLWADPQIPEDLTIQWRIEDGPNIWDGVELEKLAPGPTLVIWKASLGGG